MPGMLNYNRDLHSIRTTVRPEFFKELADDTSYAYGLDENEPDILGMREVAKPEIYNELSDEFLYWTYASAIIEEILEDPDGYRSDSYLYDPDTLNDLLGVQSSMTDAPDVLAYTRCQMMLNAPDEVIAKIPLGEIEEIRDALLLGNGEMDDYENITERVGYMWSGFTRL